MSAGIRTAKVPKRMQKPYVTVTPCMGDVVPYKYTKAQRRYLRKKFARDKELERDCGCEGCDTCTGFVRGCTCQDNAMDAIRAIHKNPHHHKDTINGN